MKAVILGLCTALLQTSGAWAQSVGDCNQIAAAYNLVEPWEENARTFSNGKTRLAVLDTVEPAAGAYHILVLSPPYDPLGGRQCRIVSLQLGLGFSGISFDMLEAAYDPSVGLMFTVPVQRLDPASGGYTPNTLYMELNQATGSLFADLYKAGE